MTGQQMRIFELFKGIGYYFKAIAVIRKHRMSAFMAIPGIMTIIYGSILVLTGRLYLQDLSGWIMAHWIPEFLTGGVMTTLISIFLWIILIFFGVMSCQIVVLAFFSPVLGHISEITEHRVFGSKPPDFNAGQLFQDIVRGLVINFRNLFMILILSVPAGFLVFIPVVGSIASIAILFLIQYYFNGFSLTDFTLERKRFSVKESIAFVKANRLRTMGIGSGYMLLMFLPIVGWFIAPAAGVVAATLSTLDILLSEKKSDSETSTS